MSPYRPRGHTCILNCKDSRKLDFLTKKRLFLDHFCEKVSFLDLVSFPRPHYELWILGLYFTSLVSNKYCIQQTVYLANLLYDKSLTNLSFNMSSMLQTFFQHGTNFPSICLHNPWFQQCSYLTCPQCSNPLIIYL